MTATPYRAINFNDNDLIGEDKMDQLANNTQWLYENTPRATYSLSDSVVRSENVRMACGRATIPASKYDHASTTVRFPGFFSPGCQPIITYGVTSPSQRYVSVVINGLGTLTQPDYRGFTIFVGIDESNKKNDRIQSRMYVNWMAMGY